jgi:hypothetical protein
MEDEEKVSNRIKIKQEKEKGKWVRPTPRNDK